MILEVLHNAFQKLQKQKKKQVKTVKTCQAGKPNDSLTSTGWEPALPSLYDAALGQRI